MGKDRLYRSIIQSLSEQKRFGRSKYEQQRANRAAYLAEHGSLRGYNNARCDGIYSYRTYDSYIQTGQEFSRYMTEHHPQIRSVGQVTHAMISEYIDSRRHLSAWTLAKDRAAISKITGKDLTSIQLPIRKFTDIKRSRLATNSDKRGWKSTKNAPIIKIAVATGARRNQLCRLTPNSFIRNHKGDCIAVHFHKDKNGKSRTAPILCTFIPAITAIVDRAAANGKDKPIFDSYDRNIDNHAYRRFYAQQLYNDLMNNNVEYIPPTKHHARADETYKGKNRQACYIVSESLGHSRILSNYLF